MPSIIRDGIGDVECNRHCFSYPMRGDGLVISAYAPTRVDGRLCKIKITLPDSLRDEWEIVGGTGDRESALYVGPLRSEKAVNTEGADGIVYIDDVGTRDWGRMHIFLRSNKGRAGSCNERTMIARHTRFEVSGIDDHADRANTRRELEIGMMNAATITTLGGAQ